MMLMAFCLDTKVAASHLDTVLDKLKDILDNVGDNFFKRLDPVAYDNISTPTVLLVEVKILWDLNSHI